MHKELAMMIAGTVLFGVLIVAVPQRLGGNSASERLSASQESALQRAGDASPAEMFPQPPPSPSVAPSATPLPLEPYLGVWPQPDVWPVRDFNVPEPELTATSSIVMLADSEKILFERALHERLPVASITKLLTALTALENGQPETIIAVSEEALAQEGASQLALGEHYTLAELILFMLLPSSNDAARQIWLANGQERFTGKMNEKARALGMRESFFPNPNGLHDPRHFSTAYDVALLAKATLGQEFLARSLALTAVTVTSQEGRSVTLQNSNKLLEKTPRLLWGKTGFTNESRETLVAVTEEGVERAKVIFVVLGSSDRFKDMEKLIEWAREAYKF